MEQVIRGKRIILSIIVVCLSINVLSMLSVTIMLISSGNPEVAMSKLLTGVIRLSLECALLYFLYKGQTWAKAIQIVLLFLGGGFVLISQLSEFYPLLFILGVVYTGMGLALCLSPSVKQFLLSQRVIPNESAEEPVFSTEE